jgi:hypothetical protein
MRLNWCAQQWYCTIVSGITILVLWAASEYYESISVRCYGTTLQWIRGGLIVYKPQARLMINDCACAHSNGLTIFTLCPSTVLFPTWWTLLIGWIRGLMMFAVMTVQTMLCHQVQSTMHMPPLMPTLPVRQDNQPELLSLKILMLGNILTSRFPKAPMKRTHDLRKAIPI